MYRKVPVLSAPSLGLSRTAHSWVPSTRLNATGAASSPEISSALFYSLPPAPTKGKPSSSLHRV